MTPAKLLLFGEHTVLHGGEALALPLRRFGARWSRGLALPDAPFVKWAAFAKTRDALRDALDVDRFAAEAPTLSVASDIPRDYGLGSSGALSALVYRRYRRVATDPDLPVLRKRLAALEDFFHGSSSGIDPLVCYLEQALHVRADGSVAIVAAPTRPPGAGAYFLLDSRQPKAGQAAIARFRESCREEGFRQNYLTPALALTQQLIRGTQTAPTAAWREHFAELSALQLQHLGWLIPQGVRAPWAKWLSDGQAYVKLCGAGGGGYFLGYAPAGRPSLDEDVIWL